MRYAPRLRKRWGAEMEGSNVLRSVICASLAWLALGCGSGDGAEPLRLVQSQILLQEPPGIIQTGLYRGAAPAWNWSFDAESASVALTHAERGAYTLELDGEARVLAARVRTLGAQRYLVVAAVNTDDEFTMYRFHDDDGDGGLDASTKTVVLESAPAKMYVSSFADASSTGTSIYLLDCRCGDIFRAVDTDADSWADSIEAVPFAASANFPALEDARAIRSNQAGVVDISETEWGQGENYLWDDTMFSRLTDSSGDEIADSVAFIELDGTAEFPMPFGDPYLGQTSIKASGTDGAIAEVWTLQANGLKDERLGSAILGGSGYTPIALSRALEATDVLGIYYASGGAATVPTLTVFSAWPQVVSTAGTGPTGFVELAGGAMTLKGLNFSQTMTVVLRTAGGTGYVLSTSNLTSESVTVTVPALGPGDAGKATIVVTEPSQPEDETWGVLDTYVCDPADLGGDE